MSLRTTARLVYAAIGAALSVSLCSPAWADDIKVGCQILDPEFHEDLFMVTYQHIDVQPGPVVTQQARVQWVSKTDGTLLNVPGVMAIDLNTYGESQAGPKFANGNDGTFIAYSRRVGAQRTVGLRKYNPAGGCVFGFGSPLNCFLTASVVPANPINSQLRAIVYTSEEESYNYAPAKTVYHYTALGSGTNQLRFTDIATWFPGPGTEAPPITADPPQWGRIQEYRDASNNKQLWISTVQKDAGVDRIKLINTATGASQWVTPTVNTFAKFNPFLFYDPTTQTNLVVIRSNENVATPATSNIEIWQENPRGSQVWGSVPYQSIAATDLLNPDGSDESPRPFLLSPETFVASDKAYVVFSSADELKVDMQMDGNIWVAKVGAPVSAVRVNTRLASPDDQRIRVEGEIYFGTTLTPGIPVVYYSQIADATDPPTYSDCVPVGSGGYSVRNFTLRRATLSALPN